MATKIPVSQVVVVEGKYDKIALSHVIDAHIVTTEGFGVFHGEEKKVLLHRLAEKHGLIILTDSDGGGHQIRSTLSGLLPKDRVTHLYIPARAGKEKRKKAPSKAGLLGVEGMDPDTLRALFLPFASGTDPRPRGEEITTTDLYLDGLLGGEGATEKRRRLTDALDLPPLSARPLLATLNLLYGKDAYRAKLKELFGGE